MTDFRLRHPIAPETDLHVGAAHEPTLRWSTVLNGIVADAAIDAIDIDLIDEGGAR